MIKKVVINKYFRITYLIIQESFYFNLYIQFLCKSENIFEVITVMFLAQNKKTKQILISEKVED